MLEERMPMTDPPPMWDFYTSFYQAVRTSRAYSEFCTRVFGRDLSQHGFSDMAQIDRLLQVARLGPGNRAVDLGCGSGGIAEFISDRTGAHVTGLDFIPEAIRQAQARTIAKADRLTFVVGDIGNLDFPPSSFDTLISIDTLYFTDLAPTLARMVTLLTPGGQMLIYFSHGANPEQPLAVFPLDTLPPDRTPLAVALHGLGLAYRTWDVTAEDERHAQLKRQVLEELRPAFAAEGNLFLFENRYGEALGVLDAIHAHAHKRYLYHAVV